jgi:hypothetical protein
MQLRAILFLGLATLRFAPPADAAKCPRGSLTGPVTHVRDGDTIVVGSMPIRLNGLAAPKVASRVVPMPPKPCLSWFRVAPCGANSTASGLAIAASESATSTARTSAMSWSGVVVPEIAPGLAMVAMPRQNVKLLPAVPRSARFMPCPGTVGRAEVRGNERPSDRPRCRHSPSCVRSHPRSPEPRSCAEP